VTHFANAEKIQRDIFRIAILLIGLILFLSGVLPLFFRAHAAETKTTAQLRAENVTPRPVEEATANAIQREYAAAWDAMSAALEQNRPDLLDQQFVGVQRDRLAQQIDQQKKNGMATRILSPQHSIEAVFYSTEGSAMQLRDTAQVETQILDGGKIVGSTKRTAKYLVTMSVVGDRWKVRMLQEIGE
jgi:hypothetical protein